jgi:hypothetical protein
MATTRHYRWTGEVDGDWNKLGNWRVWTGSEAIPASELPGRNAAFSDHIGFFGFWDDDQYGDPDVQVFTCCDTGPTLANAATVAFIGSDPDYGYGEENPVMFENVTTGGLDVWDNTMPAGRVTGDATFSIAYGQACYMIGGRVDGNVYLNPDSQILGGSVGGKVLGETQADCCNFDCDEFDLNLGQWGQMYGMSANRGRMMGGVLLSAGTVGELNCEGTIVDFESGTISLLNLRNNAVVQSLGGNVNTVRTYDTVEFWGPGSAARLEPIAGLLYLNGLYTGDVWLPRPEAAVVDHYLGCTLRARMPLSRPMMIGG